ncbi:hypothetical protein CYMTET_12176 [Cymbomonas tetramitiformis]|uniref:PiggyBac transposable element-derived protein domain-containing protein n=1 Tax=Cymbomonas tetramitiformis TaxID=36881 RepID=A0AAE0LCB5_9CHLO|nr:hypothetical protein CYMTET_12176 [Cymbomonas tetramitiformis]
MSELFTVANTKALLRRRVKTPGEVFGARVAHKVFYGTIVKHDKPRGDPPELCMVVKYADNERCWYPVSTLKKWLLSVGEATTADSSESEELTDGTDDGESVAGEESDDETTPLVARAPAKQKETPVEKATRIAHEAHKQRVAHEIASRFRENVQAAANAETFKTSKPASLFYAPPNDYTPGLNKELVAQKPTKVEDGMAYVFQKIFPKAFWQELSRFSVAYAKKKGAGTDINAAKAPEDRHPRHNGKGQHRAWNDLWVSPDGLLLFHQSLLLMVLNHRANHEDHFSLNGLLRSVISEQYSRNAWQQSMRFFCPYDIDNFENNKGDNYDPYFKFRTIKKTLHEGIHSLINPPKVASYDEGGKPYTGKGGEGLTVHYNPKKPNKRMTMCFMFAAYGIPLAWEFYTGQRSNAYNEKVYNTAEEIAYDKTISRILRLFRQAFGSRSSGHELYFDNLFTSIFLFHLLSTLFQAVATGGEKSQQKKPEGWVRSCTKPPSYNQAVKRTMQKQIG